MRSALGPLVAAGVAWVALTGCKHEASYADVRADLPTEERDAVDALLASAGIDRGAIPARSNLYDVFWRGAVDHATRNGQRDRVDTIDHQTRDARNCLAVEGGHVVALRLAGARRLDPALVAPLGHLVVLDLHDDGIEATRGLESMGSLDHLDLSGNHIATPSGLDGLRELHSLYLADNRLTGFGGLDALRALQVLNVSGNAIPSLEGLGALESLRALSIERNPIARIEGLDANRSLVDLDLAYCNVERLENLGTMPSLKYLQLWHNQVHSLKGVEEARGLVYLGLGENDYLLGDPENVAIEARYCPGRLCNFL
jgi:Leucine-rich repeat (LRR) protein